MKKKIFSLISCFMVIVLCFGVSGCNKQEAVTDVWKDAIYKEDTEFVRGNH